MKHIQLTHNNCDEQQCNICNLFICSVCGQAEIELEPECPGPFDPMACMDENFVFGNDGDEGEDDDGS